MKNFPINLNPTPAEKQDVKDRLLRRGQYRRPVDVLVENAGSIFLFQPLTARAHAWFEENVVSESWQWFGSALAVEHRFARDLAEGLVSEGFKVR